MKDDGVPAGLVAHNAAIGACDKAGECSLVLSVLKDMRSAGIRPDAISYAGAIRCAGVRRSIRETKRKDEGENAEQH